MSHEQQQQLDARDRMLVYAFERGPGQRTGAWADEGFRRRLRADPRAAVAEETGVSVPDTVEIEVLEETPEKAYLVIPLNRVEIADEQLDVAGGEQMYCAAK
jgi:hypothetical protein